MRERCWQRLGSRLPWRCSRRFCCLVNPLRASVATSLFWSRKISHLRLLLYSPPTVLLRPPLKHRGCGHLHLLLPTQSVSKSFLSFPFLLFFVHSCSFGVCCLFVFFQFLVIGLENFGSVSYIWLLELVKTFLDTSWVGMKVVFLLFLWALI